MYIITNMDNIKIQKNVEKVAKVAKVAKKYICDLCDYSSINKNHYNKHILTSKHIDLYDENINKKHLICECGKSYKLRQSLYKHKQKCTEIKYGIDSNSDITPKNNDIDQIVDADKNPLIEILLKERQQFQQKEEQFKKEKEDLQKQVETEKLRKTIDNTQNIDTQNNLNIQINAFGCENLEHITDTFKIKCLKQIYKSIPEMVVKIHFNTKYPENHNVKIPNKKLQHASIMSTDNTWKTVAKKNTITSMVDKSFNLLDDTYEEHKGELSEMKRKNYEKYQEKYLNNDKTLHKQLENDVECLVLDGTR